VTPAQPQDQNQSPPAAAKAGAEKARPPAPEDQPFERFIPELFLPALAREIRNYGGSDCELSLVQGPMPVVDVDCWQVQGELSGGRRFWLCFAAPDLSAAKTIALSEGGAEPTLLESFLIDEKKTTLALLVSRLVQRLNGQKWLGAN
jgi:hypothetical protein